MEIDPLIVQLKGELDSKVYEASDSLGKIGGEAVLNEMIILLQHEQSDTRFLAARTLGLIEENAIALDPLLEAIQTKENKTLAGDLMMNLEGFDLSAKYVELFKLFLTGSFKVSVQAKELLDHKEFDITSRVIRKAKKHWEHYTNNAKQDELFELRKVEVDEMLNDLQNFLD